VLVGEWMKLRGSYAAGTRFEGELGSAADATWGASPQPACCRRCEALQRPRTTAPSNRAALLRQRQQAANDGVQHAVDIWTG
jgi:hypothetical protein